MSDKTKGKDTSQIPHGLYCYELLRIENDERGRPIAKTKVCPYWDSDPNQESQSNGYCHYLEVGDWQNAGPFLLWDQVKECGVNEDLDEIEKQWNGSQDQDATTQDQDVAATGETKRE